MFRKILIANRGEIAVRVIRTCRELGIATVAVYDAGDRNSLHIRMAGEVMPLTTPGGYADGAEILRVARASGAQAIHPGYGFVAERPDFVAACEQDGIVFIGPTSQQVATFQNKLETMNKVAAAGYRVPGHSPTPLADEESEALQTAAQSLGYPLVIKSCSGGRGRGTRLVLQAQDLVESARQARREAENVFGERRIYLERAIAPARHLEVQILGDRAGNIIHLGERDGSLQRNNQKLFEESPAPSLTPDQRAALWAMALGIARLFGYQSAGTVEFLMDASGNFYFTEIKARIQMEHPVSELVSRVDIVAEQIRVAAGEPLSITQDDVILTGCAIQARINAEDPWNHYLPSPGLLERFRIPSGANIRVDTYGCAGCQVPVQYDPILAKVIVWGRDRADCVQRLQRALHEFAIRGVQSNLTLLQQIASEPAFVSGDYDTRTLLHLPPSSPLSSDAQRDLAVAAAVAYLIRNQSQDAILPERLLTGWHRSSRAIA